MLLGLGKEIINFKKKGIQIARKVALSYQNMLRNSEKLKRENLGKKNYLVFSGNEMKSMYGS